MTPTIPRTCTSGLLAALLLDLAFAFGAAAGESGLELDVMTFNIRFGSAQDGDDHWTKRRELVFDVLREHRPDVVGVQEALRFQLDEIRAALPSYAWVGVGRDAGQNAGEFAPILYREERFELLDHETFWFSDTPQVVASKSWGNEIPRICTWVKLRDKGSGLAFRIYNVHLDHRSQESREKSAGLLARRIAARGSVEPFVVTGDFNAGEDNAAVLHISGVAGSPIALDDSFRRLHASSAEVGTYNAFRGEKSGAKIDYVFVPRWCAVEAAAIIRDSKDGRYPSDHFPVSARIRLPAVREI